MTNRTDEKRMYFKISGGVTLLATLTEFNAMWKDYILSRGETYTIEEIESESL